MKPANPTASKPVAVFRAQPESAGWLGHRMTPVVVAVLLFAVTVAVFWPAIHHPFMAIDDSEYVTDHPLVPLGLTWPGVGFAFTARHSGNWHPLTTLSHMLDCQMFGLNPAGHHFVNVLLHAVNAVLVFWVLFRMTGGLRRSSMVAAFFALHPLRVESVAWVSERKDVLSVFFFLLTVWAYWHYAKGRRRAPDGSGPEQPALTRGSHAAVHYGLALFCFVLGLMSKPMLVTLPCVLLLLDYWPLQRVRWSDVRLRRSSLASLWPLLREKMPFFVLSLLVSYITSQVQQGAMAELRVLPVGTRVVNMFLSYGQYLAQTFWPAHLAVVYPYDLRPPVGDIAIAVTLVLALTVLAWHWRARLPWVLVGWLWFLGTLIPVIGIVQVGIQAHADRYTYLPSIGLLVLVVWTVAHFACRKDSVPRPGRSDSQACSGSPGVQRGLLVLAAVSICALAVVTRAQLAHWESTEKLMLHTERVAGSSELVRGSLGVFYYQEGRLKEAEIQYRLGLQLDGDAWPSVVGLANVYAAQGKAAEAERLYRRALAGRPTPAHHFQLADFLNDQQRYDEARIHYLQGLARVPYHAGARTRLGNVYAAQQNWPAAREQYERALRLNPRLHGVHFNLGNLQAIQGRRVEAIEHFQRALELNPNYAEAHNSLGYAFALDGRLDDAIRHYRAALELRPDFAAAHYNFGEALARRGELGPASAHFEAALKHQTNYARAHIGLAGIASAQRQSTQAAQHLRAALRLEPDNADGLNNLAWLLATSPEATVRDGREAVRLALRAVALTQTNEVDVLDTLAAAHAEAGQFGEAVEVARQTFDLAEQGGRTDQLPDLANRLESYRKGVAFRTP